MSPNNYLQKLDICRQELAGIARTWADYNMALEILDVRPTPDIIKAAIDGCQKIITDLESRQQTRNIMDALDVKRNQLNELIKMEDTRI